MRRIKEAGAKLLTQMQALQAKNAWKITAEANCFEPDMPEYPEQYGGEYDKTTGMMILRFEVRGTRYEGRTEQIEHVHAGDEICVIRDMQNTYNHNNFAIKTKDGVSVGNMPAELCNAIAPLYDIGALRICRVTASFVAPISKRSRYARQAVLFIELCLKLHSEVR